MKILIGFKNRIVSSPKKQPQNLFLRLLSKVARIIAKSKAISMSPAQRFPISAETFCTIIVGSLLKTSLFSTPVKESKEFVAPAVKLFKAYKLMLEITSQKKVYKARMLMINRKPFFSSVFLKVWKWLRMITLLKVKGVRGIY